MFGSVRPSRGLTLEVTGAPGGPRENEDMNRRGRLTVGLGRDIRRQPIPLHGLATIEEKLFRFKQSAISTDHFNRSDIRLRTCQKDATESEPGGPSKRLTQDCCAEARTPCGRTNAIADIAAFAVQRLGQGMADVRHSHHLDTFMN